MSLFPRPVELVREKRGAAPPPVSVIVTLYDYAQYLEECLESVRAQTLSAFELVIVDDASTDDGLAVAQDWLARHEAALSAFRLLHHTKNMGLAFARNTAFANAAAPYVFVLDADNVLYPRALAQLLDALRASGAGAAYSQLEIFGDREAVGLADFWSRDRLKRAPYIDAMALVDKRAWEKVGGYSQLMANGWEDYDFWCKFVEHDLAAVFVPEILCRYRWHAKSMSLTETRPANGTLTLEMSLRHPWLEL